MRLIPVTLQTSNGISFGPFCPSWRTERTDLKEAFNLPTTGLSMALAGVPGIVEIAAKAAWYAEGSRQTMFWPVMRQSSDVVVNSLLVLVIGTATAASAGRIASLLDRGRS